MKRLLFVFAISIASSAFAKSSCPQYHDRDFDIMIKNNTGQICTLIQHTLNNGRYVNEKKIPTMILTDQESLPFRLTIPNYGLFSLLSTNIELSYQCGNDKFVTFESQKTFFSGHGLANPMITITGSYSAISNMDAKFHYTRGSCEKNQSSTMYWTLY